MLKMINLLLRGTLQRIHASLPYTKVDESEDMKKTTLSIHTILIILIFLRDGVSCVGNNETSKNIQTKTMSAVNDPIDNKLFHSGFALLTNSLIQRSEEKEELSSLLSFLVTSSTGTQVILLHDYTIPDITMWWYGGWRWEDDAARRGSVNIFRYPDVNKGRDLDEGIDDRRIWLEEILYSANKAGSVTTVLVVCSTQHILNIFRQIREKSLESWSLQWLIVMQDNGLSPLLETLREGTQVAVALRETRGKYQLYSTFIAHDNKFKYKKCGMWKWNKIEGIKSYITSPLHQPIHILYNNLYGRHLKAAIVDNWPFFGTKRAGDGTIHPDTGIDTSLLRALSQKLNFTFTLLEAMDGQWGGILPNGSVTGMVGLVSRHEAQLAIDEITITEVRETVVDFTSPYYLEMTTLVSQAPKQRNRAFAILSPFTLPVWLLLAGATAVMGPLLFSLSQIRQSIIKTSDNTPSITSFSANVFRSLIYQDTSQIPNDNTLRIAFFSWFFFGFTIYVLYAGTLTAELARPAHEPPIDSLSDALNAITKRGYELIVVRGTTNEYILREAKPGSIYNQLWNVFNQKTGYVEHYTHGIEKVLKGQYVYLDALLSSQLQTIKRGSQKYHLSRDNFNPQGYGIVLTTGSPFKVIFERILGYFAAAGLLQKWVNDEKAKVSGFAGGDQENSAVIKIVHLQAAFFFLVMGYLASGFVLIFEVLSYYCAHK